MTKNHVEDDGEGEAEDDTKQESKLEEEDATMEVQANDVRMAALTSHVLGDVEDHHQMHSGTFPAQDDVRYEALAYAELRISVRFRESCVQKQDAVRDDPMNAERRAASQSRKMDTKLGKCWSASKSHGKGAQRAPRYGDGGGGSNAASNE